MSMKKKDLVTQEEIDKCLRYVSVLGRNNNSAQEQQQLLKLLQQIQITLDEPEIEDAIIESYDELEKGIIPTLYEVLGLLKRIYFMPEEFSNRLVVDRIHKLRNMFSKDEILTLPSIDPSNKAGLIPI